MLLQNDKTYNNVPTVWPVQRMIGDHGGKVFFFDRKMISNALRSYHLDHQYLKDNG